MAESKLIGEVLRSLQDQLPVDLTESLDDPIKIAQETEPKKDGDFFGEGEAKQIEGNSKEDEVSIQVQLSRYLKS